MKYLVISFALLLFSNATQLPQKGEEECIFDLATQTDEFVRNVAEFGDYIWNDEAKTATITLQNGEKIIAHRGGCMHFGISAKWTLETENHNSKDVNYWIEKARWVNERIMSEADTKLFDELLQTKKYAVHESENFLVIDFFEHNYTEWTISVNWNSKYGSDDVIFETGYYFQ